MSRRRRVQVRTDEEIASVANSYQDRIPAERITKIYVTKEENAKTPYEKENVKQLQKQTQEELREMNSKIDELRMSHKKLLTQLEAKAKSPPQANNTQTQSVQTDGPEYEKETPPTTQNKETSPKNSTTLRKNATPVNDVTPSTPQAKPNGIDPELEKMIMRPIYEPVILP